MKKVLISLSVLVIIMVGVLFSPMGVDANSSKTDMTTTTTSVVSTTKANETTTKQEETTKQETTTEKKETTTKVETTQATTTTTTKPTYESTGDSFGGVELKYNESYNITSKKLTRSGGVAYYDGHKETWYSQKVLPGGGLNIPGRHVADDGTVRDEDGYICVAADPGYYSRGSKLMTSLGPAKVYDCGCAYGTIDVYVNW